MINPLRKEVTKNTKGVDYVIGDLHGCYDMFQRLLVEIKFDPTKDRMFCVGDLVDRGPKSLDCIRLISEPWFHTVFANHEQMMMHSFAHNEPWYDKDMSFVWYMNGGDWGMEAKKAFFAGQPLHDSELCEIVHYAKKLREIPYILNIPVGDEWVHLVHAELPPCVLEGVDAISDDDLRDDSFVKLLFEVGQNNRYGYDEGHDFIWGRHTFEPLYGIDLDSYTLDEVQKIVDSFTKKCAKTPATMSLVISGHTPVSKPVFVGQHLNIDTGAVVADIFPGYGLTCYNLHHKTFTTVHSTHVSTDAQPVRLKKNV